MQYERPNLEVISYLEQDIITLSIGIGDGENVDGSEGGWSN